MSLRISQSLFSEATSTQQQRARESHNAWSAKQHQAHNHELANPITVGQQSDTNPTTLLYTIKPSIQNLTKVDVVKFGFS